MKIDGNNISAVNFEKKFFTKEKTQEVEKNENVQNTVNDSVNLEVDSSTKAESNFSFVDDETDKFKSAVEKTADSIRNAKSPEDVKKILDSFKRTVNSKSTGISGGMIGDGLGFYGIKTEYKNGSLRPFIKYTKEKISEAKDNGNNSEKEIYQNILKTLKEARKERFNDDSTGFQTTPNLIKLY